MTTTTPLQRHRLGERIVKARGRMGWNQFQLATAADIPQGYLSEIERGIKRPSLDTLKKLREALQLDETTWLSWIDAA